MNIMYIFIVIAAVLIAVGISFYFFQRSSKKGSQYNEPNEKAAIVPENKIGAAAKTPAVSRELTALKQELMTMTMHNQRVYQNNIEIARKDFSRRNISDPSETDLIRRAIEIWRDDNR